MHINYFLLFILKHIDESSDMGQNLNCKLIAIAKSLLGFPAQSYTGRSSCDDNGSSRQSSALRQEANKLGDAEDQVTRVGTLETSSGEGGRKIAYSIPQSWRTVPFLRPFIHNFDGSGIRDLRARVGPGWAELGDILGESYMVHLGEHIPMGHAPSKPLEKDH